MKGNVGLLVVLVLFPEPDSGPWDEARAFDEVGRIGCRVSGLDTPNHLSAKRNIFIGAPMQFIIHSRRVLQPDSMENFHCRNMTKPIGSIWSKDHRQQTRSVFSDVLCSCDSILVGFREICFFKPVIIAVNPFFLAVLQQPIWHNGS